MAATNTNTNTKIQAAVHDVLAAAIAELESIGVAVPASLFLAMIIVQRHAAVDDERES